MEPPAQDRWSDWLLHRRFGGDPQAVERARAMLHPVRDRVLDQAQLHDAAVLLDVGCGDGLIAFGALERYPTCRVIFSDISQPLLDHAAALAGKHDLLSRCSFLRAAADNLTAVADGSVDAVTTRSVLIYVKPKLAAFQEFYRVLKPQGRLSIFEPINRFAAPEPPHLFHGYDVTPIQHLAVRIKAVMRASSTLDPSPMIDFDERDLLRWAEEAGFQDIHLRLEVEILAHTEDTSWDAFLHTAGNPLDCTIAEAIERALTPEESDEFTRYLQPLVVGKRGTRRMALAYLWASKPGLGV
ncbi:MAG TPA: methyltransferase domain-containing protein [Herpetosiphonaceae bacterium]